jgi:hypothetical protein
MIDYATPADRLGTSLEVKRARANAYLDANGLSVLRHGFRPTKACNTDVRQTQENARRRNQAQAQGRITIGVPSLLQRQAA